MFNDSIDPDTGEATLDPVDSTISTRAMSAAVNFVETCCQHAAYVAGRRNIDEEVKQLVIGRY